jgi:hypothetical protein
MAAHDWRRRLGRLGGICVAGLSLATGALVTSVATTPATTVSAYNLESPRGIWRGAIEVLEPDKQQKAVTPQMQSWMHSEGHDWSGTPTPLYVNVYDSNDGARNIATYYQGNTNGYAGLGGDTTTGSSIDGNGDQYIIAGYVELCNNNCYFSQSSGLAVTGQEMGHSFGLGHSCLDNVIMSGPWNNCPNHQYNTCYDGSCVDTIHQDDINAVNDLYRYYRSTGASCEGANSVLTGSGLVDPQYPMPDPSQAGTPILSGPGGPVGYVQGAASPDTAVAPAPNPGQANVAATQQDAQWWIENWAYAPFIAQETTGKAIGVRPTAPPSGRMMVAC